MTAKVFFPVFCLLVAGACFAQAPPVPACHMVSFGGSLAQGQELDKDIASGLQLRVWPTPMGKALRDEGWFIDVISQGEPAGYYLNFVNVPLRESNNRVLGPGYNVDTRGHNTAEQSLSHVHEMRFLLTKGDYDQVSAANEKVPGVFEGSTEALDEAGRKYQEFQKLVSSMPTGWLSFRILSFKVDPSTGFPLSIQFQVDLSAPSTFTFAPDLKPTPTQCHPSAAP